MTLPEKTRAMLKSRPTPLTLKTIARELNIPRSWLSMFLTERVKDGSSARMEMLYNYLLSRKA